MKTRSLASRRERPLIGVTTSEMRRAESLNPTPEGEPPTRLEMALGLPYLRGLEAAGALPLVMPPLSEDAIEPLLDRLDGICLSGGPDLDPAGYGAEPHPELGPIEPNLDRFELAVARRADAREMPILAICRGTQAINIVRGGTLHQHLPEISTEIAHRQRTARQPDQPPGRGRSRQRAGGGAGRDRDRRHRRQLLPPPGDRPRSARACEVSARAPDGTIEGVEDPSRPFLIGVQWHAETLVHRVYEAALFRNFVDACRDDGAEFQRRSGREVA